MSTEPTKVPILANASDKNDILTNADSGSFTVNNGFGARLEQDLFPDRADFNGLFYLLSKTAHWFGLGGFFVWDSAVASSGGYPIRAIVKKSDNSGYWSNTVDNNTSNPDTGGAGWVDFSPVAVLNDSEKWDALPKGYTQPFIPEVMGVNITTWLAAHPKWAKLDNTEISGIEGRAMAVAGNGHAAGSQAGSDDAVVVSHTHTATDAGHTHTTNIDYSNESGSSNPWASGGGTNEGSIQFQTGSGQAQITVSETGVSGTNANIQRTQYLDWIVKVTA